MEVWYNIYILRLTTRNGKRYYLPHGALFLLFFHQVFTFSIKLDSFVVLLIVRYAVTFYVLFHDCLVNLTGSLRAFCLDHLALNF